MRVWYYQALVATVRFMYHNFLPALRMMLNKDQNKQQHFYLTDKIRVSSIHHVFLPTLTL